MLSGETTMGKHPIETVAAMARICEVTEKYAEYNIVEETRLVNNARDAIATAVVETPNTAEDRTTNLMKIEQIKD